jgi:hypothetical protein
MAVQVLGKRFEGSTETAGRIESALKCRRRSIAAAESIKARNVNIYSSISLNYRNWELIQQNNGQIGTQIIANNITISFMNSRTLFLLLMVVKQS